MGKKHEFNENQFLELYNQGKTDSEIGEIMGFKRRYICNRRLQLGLKQRSITRLTKECKQQIVNLVKEGKTDKEIAIIMNLKIHNVTQTRNNYNLQPNKDVLIRGDIENKVIQLWKEGKMDSEISNITGVNKATIQLYRKQHGLASKFTYDKVSKINNKKFEELFYQGLTDFEIGKELGMSADGIYSHRMRHKYYRDNYTLAVKKELTQYQKEVLIGTLLGDSSLRLNGVNPTVSCAHCPKQKELTIHKAEIFKSLGAYYKYSIRNTPDKRTGKYYECYTMRIGANPELKEWYLALYPNGKKIIPMNLVKECFSEVSLAFMFMDDGSKTPCGYSIATNCFTKDNIKEFQKFLEEKFNLHTTIHSQNVLYIKACSKDLFTSLIRPYIIPCMQYKLHN